VFSVALALVAELSLAEPTSLAFSFAEAVVVL
jgi:hypothetical protein